MIEANASVVEAWADSVVAGPDPILCANVYCSGRLGEVISRMLKPCWLEFIHCESAVGCHVWVMRYARGGEHLKIRLHGPENCRIAFRDLLEAAQKLYFKSLKSTTRSSPPSGWTSAPPIDAEDAVSTDYPDRTLLWTTYKRSSFSLGYPPFLTDDWYLYFLTRCLGQATELIMLHSQSDEDGCTPFLLQRRLLLQALITGLAALPLSDFDRARYLIYHRDGLMRYLRRRRTQGLELSAMEDGPKMMARALLRFDREIEQLGPERNSWLELMHKHWHIKNDPKWGKDFAAWSGSLFALFSYLKPYLESSSQQLDPFADLPIFPLLFKVFHGFANQVGVNHLNEAFLCHLLADIASERRACQWPVRLIPYLL